MNNERKILYMSAIINLVIGVSVGIVLFFGQLRSGNSLPENIYDYEKNISVSDFLTALWINALWLFSIPLAYGLLRVRLIHPVVIVRGAVTSFTVLYTLQIFGFREASASVIPQCLCVLPMLIMFSAETASSRKGGERGADIIVRKSEIFGIIALSIVSAGIEVLVFNLFCTYLF